MKVRQERHLKNCNGAFAAADTSEAALFSIKFRKDHVLAGLAYATSFHVKLPKLRPLEFAIFYLKPPNIRIIIYYLEGVSYVHIYSTLRLLHIRFLLLCRIGGSVII